MTYLEAVDKYKNLAKELKIPEEMLVCVGIDQNVLTFWTPTCIIMSDGKETVVEKRNNRKTQ